MLSVAGFDDAPLAQIVWPALTTISHPVRALAAAAADLLLAGDVDAEREFAHALVVRESTAPPNIPWTAGGDRR
jgi:LacI family transcriptional regulator